MKVTKLIFALLVVVLAVTLTVSATPNASNGGESLDPETAELLDRYLKMRRISAFGYMGGLPSWSAVQQKRNSELINSILGLPKVMNDAGRKK